MKIKSPLSPIDIFINEVDINIIRKLKELNVFNEYKNNLILLYREDLRNMHEDKRNYLTSINSFNSFIYRSFAWRDTIEGSSFWIKIFNS